MFIGQKKKTVQVTRLIDNRNNEHRSTEGEKGKNINVFWTITNGIETAYQV